MGFAKVAGGVALLAALMAAVVDARADVKAYHGSVCRQATGPSNYVAYGQYGISSVLDDPWVGIGVWCPVTRDRINSSSSLTEIAIEGWNEANPNTNNSLICTLYNQEEDLSSGSQTAITYVDFDTQSTTTVGNFNMSFSAAASNGNEGAMAVTCGLSFHDRIYHLHVNESNGATD